MTGFTSTQGHRFMTSLALDALVGNAPIATGALTKSENGESPQGSRTRFAFLAETSRCLGDSLDFQSTLETAAALALPHFGTWCMVDVIEPNGAIRRVAVIHPNAAKQAAERAYYEAHPPCSDDPIGS